MGSGSGPRAPQWPITSEWKAMISAHMKETGVIQAELARRLKTSNAQITWLFTKAKSSGMVPAIHKALKLPSPGMPGSAGEIDELKDEIDEGWEFLDEEERRLIAHHVRVLRRRRTTT